MRELRAGEDHNNVAIERRTGRFPPSIAAEMFRFRNPRPVLTTPSRLRSERRGVIAAFSAARLVMERSPHSVLAGEGATTFALANGIGAAETLTEDAREQFEAWRQQQSEEARRARASLDREESHDTVGMVLSLIHI